MTAAPTLLFLLGVMEGLIGCFQFTRAVGSFPLVALVLAVAIGVTCVLGAAGMGSPAGALVPALGWFAVSVVLSLPTAGGSVIITNSTAGQVVPLRRVAVRGRGRRGGLPAPGPDRAAPDWRPPEWPAPAPEHQFMTAVDGADFRRVAGQFASGIMVVTTRLDGVDHAMTVTAFASVSLEPQLVLFCAEKIARFHDAVLAAGHLGGVRAR